MVGDARNSFQLGPSQLHHGRFNPNLEINLGIIDTARLHNYTFPISPKVSVTKLHSYGHIGRCI